MMIPFKFFEGYSVRNINPDIFETIGFPIITRVFCRLLSSDIVSVQPLSPPIGRFLYVDNIVTIKKSFKDFKLLRG